MPQITISMADFSALLAGQEIYGSNLDMMLAKFATW